MNFDIENTFETTNAISSMYLWLIFGYLSALINCDLQRFMLQNPFVIHSLALVAFFFLFTLLDSNNQTNVGMVWVKTVVIYAIFLLVTKSKWYFALPVLGLLLVDQTLKKHVQYLERIGKIDEATRSKYKLAARVLNGITLGLIVFGTLHYMVLQKIEYKENFSFVKFFFALGQCKSNMPDYHMMHHVRRKIAM
jgi:hypothetical protein